MFKLSGSYLSLVTVPIIYVLATCFVLFKPVLRLVRIVYDYVIHTVFALFFYTFKKSTPLPPVFNPTLLLSGTQLAKSIRERKMTSVQVVRAYISRISDVNPLLNALAQEVFRSALQEALKVDERIAQGYGSGLLNPEILEESEPFLGVPFTVKESIGVAGLKQTGGLICRRYCTASRDSHVVEAMRKAGGILIATSNVSELGLWWESENRLYGHTCNPYDLNRTSGGSSGGEAALMSACGTPLSIGTDVGGSVRIPAFFCGLFGHKPTSTIISLRGATIRPVKDTDPLLTVGPITRHAEDLAPMLRVMAGPQNISALGLDITINLGQVKVFSVADDSGGVLTSPVARELREVHEKVCQHFLRSHDILVKKMKIPAFSESLRIFIERMKEVYADESPMAERLTDCKGSINIFTEFTRAALGRANHTWPCLIQAVAELIYDRVKSSRTEEAYPLWKNLRASVQRLLGKNGVLLYPSHPTLAPFHREALPLFANFTYTSIFNCLGFPVTQVPLGISKEGLPLGIQVVGGLNMDGLTIAVAADLEKAFGGWKCPAEII